MRKKIIAILPIAALALSLLVGCESGQSAEKIVVGALEQNSIEEAARMEWLQKVNVPSDREFVQFSSLNALLMELNAGRVDCMRLPESVSEYLLYTDDKLLTVKRGDKIHYHMATRAEDSALCEELSTAFDALRADGTMETLIKDYITDAEGAPSVNRLVHHEGAETHVVAVTGDLPPLDYVASDGTPAGFNIALLNAISEKTGCNFEIVQMDAAARLTALTAKKVDLVFWIGCQSIEGYEPKQESVSLTEPYFEEDVCFVAYSQGFLPPAAEGQPE